MRVNEPLSYTTELLYYRIIFYNPRINLFLVNDDLFLLRTSLAQMPYVTIVGGHTSFDPFFENLARYNGLIDDIICVSNLLL